MKNLHNISKVGVYHLLHSMEISDRVSGEWVRSNVFCVRIADGSSSSALQSIGADTCVRESISFFKDNYSPDFFTDNRLEEFLDYIKQKLRIEAKKYGASVNGLDSTITVVIIESDLQRFNYISAGTEAILKVTDENEIRIICGAPEENSINGETYTFGRHSTKDLKSVIVATDGLFQQMYKVSDIQEPYKTFIINNDPKSLLDTVGDSLFYDDATMVYIELE